MSDAETVHTFDLGTCIAFSRPRAPWGALSNFSTDFPLYISGKLVPTTEHLYQACRFPHLPDLQKTMCTNPSPAAAKMRAHKHVEETRPDWEDVRVPIMRWCLAVKLAQHRATFGALLRESESELLVEVSGDDAFWGAVPDAPDSKSATGANMLGNLLMDLRAILSSPTGGEAIHSEGDDHGGGDQEWVPAPPGWLGLRLCGHEIVGERAPHRPEARQE